jgi:hypothetical protein
MLKDSLGEDIGVVQLTRGGEQWRLYWPGESWPLWIYSPLRLPGTWNLARSLDPRTHMYTFAAASGDVLAAMTTHMPQERHPESQDEPPGVISSGRADEVEDIKRTLGLGGQTFREQIESRLEVAPVWFAGAVLEVN